jgi:hypothetical protein
MRVAPHLRDLRGQAWQDLVDQAVNAPEGSLEQLAFSLLLIRLNGCLTCYADCYRAMRGCTDCAVTTVRRYRGDDEELISMYEEAVVEVEEYIKGQRPFVTEDE